MKRLSRLVSIPIVLLGLLANSACGGIHETFLEPPKVQSKNGRLDVELTAKMQEVVAGGQRVVTRAYNDLFTPPTLFVQPGDTIYLRLNNLIDEDTNLHYHGMNVSPMVPGDNVFLNIQSGQIFDYEVRVPEEHPEGLFYYHPHRHGLTEFQIGSGMSGLLIVEGLLNPFPELVDITQRVMMLKDIQIVDGMIPNPPVSANPTLRTLNGQVNPSIAIRPGEIQLWRVGNIGADIYYDLELEGHTLYEIARDGNLHNQLVPFDHILLPTSSRSEFLVVGGPVGEYAFNTRGIFMGPQGDTYPETQLATLISEGSAVPEKQLPTDFPQDVPDLRDAPLCCNRTFDFSESMDGSQFCINNTQFDGSVTNTNIQLGCVERWTLNNCTGENHVFHIHQLDFQVVEKNGQPVDFTGHQDTVALDYRAADPAHPDRCQCDASGNCTGCTCPTPGDPHGSVVVLIPFTNPVIAGDFVYHCHIGEHEDNGMMQKINVSEAAGQCEAGTPDATMREMLSPTERAVCDFMADAHHTSSLSR
jgi:FtsP/CotA-like multicopper oxidase with cupredoxin domain